VYKEWRTTLVSPRLGRASEARETDGRTQRPITTLTRQPLLPSLASSLSPGLANYLLPIA
jgi:hypothetical protein